MAGIYDITESDLKVGRRMRRIGFAAPALLTIIPFLITMLLFLATTGGPPAAAAVLFLGLIATGFGLVVGSTISGIMFVRHSRWTREMRERIAIDGIKASEIHWFRNELKPVEKRALKAMSAADALLADAYMETLASRLTATRVLKTTRREMSEAKSRLNSVSRSRSTRVADIRSAIESDLDHMIRINGEAKDMLDEAESRLRLIETTAARKGTLAGSELALKRLSGQAEQLPLALEAARESDKFKVDIEREFAEEKIGDE